MNVMASAEQKQLYFGASKPDDDAAMKLYVCSEFNLTSKMQRLHRGTATCFSFSTLEFYVNVLVAYFTLKSKLFKIDVAQLGKIK